MEDNKLIAQFMKDEDYQEMGEYVIPNYHTSWDWLMPVINKIETMGCEVVHRVGDCNIYKIDKQENYRCIIDVEGINKLESTYKAVVEFIKNHKI